MAHLMQSLPAERRTVYHLIKSAADTWGTAPALQQPTGSGNYRTYSWLDYRQIAEEVAAGLRQFGIGRGDTVGLATQTRAEFYLADVGIMTNGSLSAAVYDSLPPVEQVKTLKACDAKAVFAEDRKTMTALLAAGGSDLKVQWFVLEGEAPGAISFDKLREIGQETLVEDPSLLGRFATEVRPADFAILYLTSGATGEPKMGLSTHYAVVTNCEMGPKVLPAGPGDCTLAFLPSAHITQRLGVEFLMIRHGIEVYFSEGISKLPKEFKAVRPTFFVAPPRVWERVYSSVSTEIRKKPAPLRKLIYFGIGLGSEAARAKLEGKSPSLSVTSWLPFFDRLIFRRIRERLGGRLRIAVSGAAPLGKHLAEFFAAIGLPINEGYGLTEGGILVLNPIGNPTPGSIGKPLPGVQVRIASDGELLVKSETLFSGYYKDPAATAAVLQDGWLHTGDVAEVDKHGYVWITGRKKEVIVSSAGKKIYPARIEGLFKLEPLVNQVLLIGDKLPYVTAIFTINSAAAEQLKNVDATTMESLAKSPGVLAEMRKVVARVNKHLAGFEQIRKFHILDRDFSLEAGELTPTLKLRRGKVLDNFKDEIRDLYMGREDI